MTTAAAAPNRGFLISNSLNHLGAAVGNCFHSLTLRVTRVRKPEFAVYPNCHRSYLPRLAPPCHERAAGSSAAGFGGGRFYFTAWATAAATA